MTNYYSAAKALDELMLELIAKGIEIPLHTVEDLKTGRSLASIGLRTPDDNEIAEKANFALQNVEMNLLSYAENAIGAEYAERWQKKIIEAYQEENSPKFASKMVSGVPKGEYWIRVQSSDLIDHPENLKTVAQDDGFTLIYGKKEIVIAFLKEIRGKMGKKCKQK